MTNIRQQLRRYCITAALTLLTLLIMVYVSDVYPFGDNLFLWADGDQYFAIEHYFATIAGKNDIFYSWSTVLGGNVLPQLAYYSFSPFNLLYIPFLHHILFAVHLVAYLKIITASVTFCYCLDEIWPDENDFMKPVLSMCYAFMGYMIYYGWNTSWMDGVILLPVMLAGIRKLVESNHCGLYVISLSLAIIANFYIGYMLCICSVMLYLAALVLHADGFRVQLKKTGVRYAAASVLSAGLSSFVLFPAVLGLPSGRRIGFIENILDMHCEIDLVSILSGLFTGQVNTLSANAPLIYIGIVPLIFAVLFFFDRTVPLKKKLVCGGILLFMVISFQNSALNILWHGMSRNAWYNNRYSFFASFVLLLAAYEGYLLVKNKAVTKREYAASILVLLGTAFLVIRFAGDHVRIPVIYVDIALICADSMVLLFANLRKPLPAVFVLVQMVYCSVMNGSCYLRDNTLFSKESYENHEALMTNAKECIADDSFYRMDKTMSYGRCDAHLFDYRGVTNYASTENMENLAFAKRLGVNYGWLSGSYTTDMPEASESLLGIKYILSDRMNPNDYDVIGGRDSVQFYRNPHVLPVLIPADALLTELDVSDDFELQNALWKSLNNSAENVFTANQIENRSNSDHTMLEVTVTKSGSVYLDIPWGSYTSIRINGASADFDLNYSGNQAIYYAGEYSEGDTFTIELQTGDDNYDLDRISCCTEDRVAIAKNAALINDDVTHITERSSSHLELDYQGDKKTVASTIPFDRGWRVYDNGRRVHIERNWSSFLSFELDQTDAHHIELKYVPPGFTAGTIVSGVSLVIAFLYGIVCNHKQRKTHSS